MSTVAIYFTQRCQLNFTRRHLRCSILYLGFKGSCQGTSVPYCHHNLHRHLAISRPLRCIDTQSTFYLIGFRYRCRYCKNPKTNKATVTFRSWVSRILAILPPALTAEFLRSTRTLSTVPPHIPCGHCPDQRGYCLICPAKPFYCGHQLTEDESHSNVSRLDFGRNSER